MATSRSFLRAGTFVISIKHCGHIALVMLLVCAMMQGYARGDMSDMATPPRLSLIDGEVSFWRTGAQNWTPARVNIPLASGDELYTGAETNCEVQVGPRAFIRAGAATTVGVSDIEPDFLQFKVTSGNVSVDIRELAPGHVVEVDTPNAAFTIEHSGYYRVNVNRDGTSFITRRGGSATATPPGSQPVDVDPSEELLISGTQTDNLLTYVAPDLDGWDRWNYARTDQLLDSMSARYVSPNVYGARDLDDYGR